MKLNLTPKLVAAFLAIGLLPFVAMGGVALRNISQALEKDAFAQLESIRAVKANQVAGYFADREADIQVLADTVAALGVTDAASVTPEVEGVLKSTVKSLGYYDLFLIDRSGFVFYTDAKEADYQTNLVNGKWASSNLGELVRRVLAGKQTGLADFAPYAPSNNEPAAFVAAPVMAGGQVRLVVGLQLSLKTLNAMMQERTGLGQTGETYLVGPDLLMRSDSFLDPKGHSVAASFADPAKGKVDTLGARNALAGKTAAEIIIDYNGNPVLSAYAPITAGGLKWAILAEIDEAEAFAPLIHIRTLMYAIGALGTLLIAFAGIVIARSIARPITDMTRVMGELSQDNLQVQVLHGDRADEIGLMAKALGHFKDQLLRVRQLEREQAEQKQRAEAERKQAMHDMADQFEHSVGRVVETVTAAATELQAASTQMADIATETSSQAQAVASAAHQASANVQTVASAGEELASSINEIARQMQRSQGVSERAGEQASKTTVLMQDLTESVGKIGEIVNLITVIASQTNLLALNATIEAARAGEAGKGFAVVANEVKGLANQTARATEEITSQIRAVQDSTANAAQAIDGIAHVIEEMAEISASVASAVQEQTAATDEIARNIEQASTGTEEVSNNITTVQKAASETGAAAEQIRTSSADLSRQAEYLKMEVGNFLAGVRG